MQLPAKRTAAFLTATLLAAGNVFAHPPANTPEDVTAVLTKVADWQIEHLRADYDREHNQDNNIRAWTYGALYVGMERWASIAPNDKYYDFLVAIGEELDWAPEERTYHADGHVVGQTYLQLYRKYGEEKMLEKMKARMDYIRENPSTQPINLANYKHTERWTWCDALFMSPPVWAMLSNITGDPGYRDWMFEEFKATTDHLWDEENSLYFRDEHYIDRLDHDRKVFWSRGNGWVFGGLALLIPEIPEGPQRDYYIDLYQKMAPSIAALQTEQGHWAMSLLAADKYPTPETSGTSFFTFGLTWGINNGFLDRETYEPIVRKAWDSLVSHVNEEGMLGYVQPVGAAPGKAWPDKGEVYGTGAFLAAGAEIHKLLLGTKDAKEGVVTIPVDGQELLGYQAVPLKNPAGGEQFKGSNYFHPLKTPSGFTVTAANPSNHHHHHFGLWWPWKFIRVEDGREVLCWELQHGDGIVEAKNSELTENGLTATSVYTDRKAPGGPRTILNETMYATVSDIVPTPSSGYFLDLKITNEVAGDQALEIMKYRYSGLTIRGTDEWADHKASVLTSEGNFDQGGKDEKKTTNFTRAKWVRIEGPGETDTAGVIIMSHPSNYNHPEKLRTWGNREIFINFNPVQDEPWIFEPGKKYVRNYRVFIYDGTVTANQADTLWEQYGAI